MKKHSYLIRLLTFPIGIIFLASTSRADFVMAFSNADFDVNPEFSTVEKFEFTIQVAGDLAPGVYADPVLVDLDYKVSGPLAGTPSGFPAFNLERSMDGNEFYSQGSSLRFEIAGNANLTDGLQLSELVGTDSVFVLDARELNTGRYHPPILELNSTGTGRMQNSNNFGETVFNPMTNELVDVDFGEEYISNLTFNPSELTLAAVPEPTSCSLVSLAVTTFFLRRRRN